MLGKINGNMRKSISLLLLSLCFLGWIATTGSVRLYNITTSTFGPYLSLNPIFWIFYLSAVSLFFIENRQIQKFFSMCIIALMSFGTLGIIMPYGRLHDSWRNIGFSYLLINKIHHVNSFPSVFLSGYVKSFPSFFIFNGVLGEISGIYGKDLIRFYPFLCMILYFASFYLLAKSLKSYESNFKSIWLLSLFFLFAIAPQLFIRSNPAPQTFAFLLSIFLFAMLFFIVAENKKKKSRVLKLILLLFSLSIITTHIITSLMVLFVFIGFMITLKVEGNRRYINSLLILSAIVFLVWTLFHSYGLKQAKIVIQNLYSVLKIVGRGYSCVGNGMSEIQIYHFMRRIAFCLLIAILVFNYVVILKYKRNLGITLLSWGISILPFAIFIFVPYGAYGDRFFLYSIIPSSIIFSVGWLLLKNKIKNGKNGKIIFGIIIASILLLSVLGLSTANHYDIPEVITKDEIEGFSFISYHTNDTHILYPICPPFPKYDDYLKNYTQLGLVYSKEWKSTLPQTESVLCISSQIDNLFVLKEKTKENFFHVLEEELVKGHGSNAKIYTNGGFRSYYVGK